MTIVIVTGHKDPPPAQSRRLRLSQLPLPNVSDGIDPLLSAGEGAFWIKHSQSNNADMQCNLKVPRTRSDP